MSIQATPAANLVDQAAHVASDGISAAHQALNGLDDRTQSWRAKISPRLDAAKHDAGELVHRSVDAVRERAALAREQALRARDGTAQYIQDQPVKAVLIAAAAGAVLAALLGMASRSRRG